MIEKETDNTESTNGISPEVREAHPELSHEIKKKTPSLSKYMRPVSYTHLTLPTN